MSGCPRCDGLGYLGEKGVWCGEHYATNIKEGVWSDGCSGDIVRLSYSRGIHAPGIAQLNVEFHLHSVSSSLTLFTFDAIVADVTIHQAAYSDWLLRATKLHIIEHLC